MTRSRIRRWRPVAAGLVTAAAAAALPVSATAAAASTVPVPPTPTGLPTAIEPLASYVPQVACDPRAKPGTAALGQLLTSTYAGTTAGISRTCGTDSLSASEHYEGRAVDWMVSVRQPSQAAEANAVLSWLLASDRAGNQAAMARRLGVMYLIWNGQIWGAYSASAGWRPYSTCASHPETSWDTTCHRNHVHISLSWAGAMRHTSYWTRQVAGPDYGPCRPADLNWAAPYAGINPTPCRSYPKVVAPSGSSPTYAALVRFSGVVLAQGATGPAVSALQGGLKVTADGEFGPQTAAALASFQRAHGLAGSAVADAATWRALLAANAPTSAPAPSNPLTPYKNLVLRYGSRGPAVVALQKALHGGADGVFDRITESAVTRFQRAHHLPATGVVGSPTWVALGA